MDLALWKPSDLSADLFLLKEAGSGPLSSLLLPSSQWACRGLGHRPPMSCLLQSLVTMAAGAAQGQVQLMPHYFLVMAFVKLIVYSNGQGTYADFILKSVTFDRNQLNTHF